MNKFVELLLGLILIVVPIVLAVRPRYLGWGDAAIEFLQGGVVVLVVLIGILFVMLGISDMKS